MKKFLALTLSVLMIFAMTACGGSGDQLKIGVMQFGEFPALQNCYDGFVAGLEEAGYKDGENIKIHLESASADTANCPTIADAMINDGSDLIFAIATPSASAIKEKTTTIPVLFSAVTDAVDAGLVSSNEEPGGNISGTSDMNPVAEQIDLVQEILPEAKKVAVLFCSSESNSAVQLELAKAELEKLGLECVEKGVGTVDEIIPAVESLKGQVDCIYVPTDNTISNAMQGVSQAADELGLPIICAEPGMVENGATITFGINYFELGKQTAAMAVKILESEDGLAEIAKMPVGFQTEECVYAVNMKSVNTLKEKCPGMSIPQEIMDSAQIMGE